MRNKSVILFFKYIIIFNYWMQINEYQVVSQNTYNGIIQYSHTFIYQYLVIKYYGDPNDYLNLIFQQ